uniref:Uncharacterized protein n=1 Tax=Populus trichocarpa TaxID=3694 RepID=A0A3N7FM85_POPTR
MNHSRAWRKSEESLPGSEACSCTGNLPDFLVQEKAQWFVKLEVEEDYDFYYCFLRVNQILLEVRE